MPQTICSVEKNKNHSRGAAGASLIASGRMPDHSNQTKADGILRLNQALE
jgi:hypothetical protein